MVPEQLKYTKDHEWVELVGASQVRLGITQFAQESLGDIVFVSLPDVGAAVSQGDSCGEVESTKSVAEIYAPVSGTVVARNDVVETSPEAINDDPYGNGWLIEISLTSESELSELLDFTDYQTHIAG